MPSRDEILQTLINEVAVLKDKVAALEAKAEAADPWDQEYEAPDPGEAIFAAPLEPAHGQPQEDDPIADTPEILEARARIAKANAEDVPGKPHQPEIEVTTGLDDGVTITVPPPTPQQTFMRRATSARVIANLPGIDHDTATHAYIEGGPLWLHAFDRHHTVELPLDLRQGFIRDLALTMPESAHELARDILKVTDKETQAAWAHDAAETAHDDRTRRG